MKTRSLLSLAFLFTCAVWLPLAAWAQTPQQKEAATLLLPFSELLARPDAGTFFHAVAMGTVNANTLETSARQAAAMHDNTIDSTRGTVLVNGMGTAIMNNYFAAIYADEAAVGPSSSPVASAFSAITSAALDNSSFGKFFFANGTTNGTTNAAGPQLPVGGQTNVYGTA